MGRGRVPPPNSQPRSGASALGRWVGSLLGYAGFVQRSVDEFADELTAAFQPGFEVRHPTLGTTWFATLDVIDLCDNQVAALVRLSRQPGQQQQSVRRGLLFLPELERVSTPGGSQQGPAPNEDLVLRYTFPLLFTVGRNLKLWNEFAANELGRLRDGESTTGRTRTPEHVTFR